MDDGSLPTLLGPGTLLYLGLFVTPGWLSRLLYRRYFEIEPEPIGSELLATISLSLLLSSVSLMLVPVVRSVPTLVPAWIFFAVAVMPVLAVYLYIWYRTSERPGLYELVLGPKLQGAEVGELREDRGSTP